jgi:hypothetical protein
MEAFERWLASGQRSQEIDGSDDSDSFEILELSEMTVARHDQMGIPGYRALENPVVVRIGQNHLERNIGFHYRGHAHDKLQLDNDLAVGPPELRA